MKKEEMNIIIAIVLMTWGAVLINDGNDLGYIMLVASALVVVLLGEELT